jgi:hypothetical protein
LALNQVLVDTAFNLAGRFRVPDALLPYWSRLSFLRVMVGLPLDNVARCGLDRVACTLVKRAKFNATTFVLEGGPLIGMNYGLEPILKEIRFKMEFRFVCVFRTSPKITDAKLAQ